MKYKLRIIRDEDAENPRKWDNLATMYCEHRHYVLGDKHAEDIRDEDGNIDHNRYFVLPLFLYDHSGITMNTTGFHCPWDSGQVGYIYLSKERFKAECARPGKIGKDGINPILKPIKRITKKDAERALKLMEGEVEVYDQYLRGDVYGFVLEEAVVEVERDEDDDEVLEWEEKDSCWGFYGDDPANNGMDEHFSVPLSECEIVYE
jgi:hypothetical protein